jgi:small lipoprotein (TIGR04452 family)
MMKNNTKQFFLRILQIFTIIFVFSQTTGCILYYEVGNSLGLDTNFESGNSAKARITDAALLNDLLWSQLITGEARITVLSAMIDSILGIDQNSYYKVKDVDKCVEVAGKSESIFLNSGLMMAIECKLKPASNLYSSGN